MKNYEQIDFKTGEEKSQNDISRNSLMPGGNVMLVLCRCAY